MKIANSVSESEIIEILKETLSITDNIIIDRVKAAADAIMSRLSNTNFDMDVSNPLPIPNPLYHCDICMNSFGPSNLWWSNKRKAFVCNTCWIVRVCETDKRGIKLIEEIKRQRGK